MQNGSELQHKARAEDLIPVLNGFSDAADRPFELPATDEYSDASGGHLSTPAAMDINGAENLILNRSMRNDLKSAWLARVQLFRDRIST
jgi:hypothetical protein